MAREEEKRGSNEKDEIVREEVREIIDVAEDIAASAETASTRTTTTIDDESDSDNTKGKIDGGGGGGGEEQIPVASSSKKTWTKALRKKNETAKCFPRLLPRRRPRWTVAM